MLISNEKYKGTSWLFTYFRNRRRMFKTKEREESVSFRGMRGGGGHIDEA